MPRGRSRPTGGAAPRYGRGFLTPSGACRVQVLMTREEYEELKARARWDGKTVSWFGREMIRAGLAATPREAIGSHQGRKYQRAIA